MSYRINSPSRDNSYGCGGQKRQKNDTGGKPRWMSKSRAKLKKIWAKIWVATEVGKDPEMAGLEVKRVHAV